MIGLLLKNWKFILDILLVIALVILLFIWNPFGIFGGGLTLTPTANLVTEVREMGQLVTSEYYGEVIASIEESRLNVIEEEEISHRVSELYTNLNGAMGELLLFQSQPMAVRMAEYKEMDPVNNWRRVIRQNVNSRNILEKLSYHGFMDQMSMDPLYQDLLGYLWWEENKEKNMDWEGKPRQTEEILYQLYVKAEKKIAPSMDESSFMNYYYQQINAGISRKESKKKLAMIGRGSVKAGFDFSTLDNHTFYINEEAGEIHFFGFSAVILNADINPWFIPEKGVPGFEILDYNGKVDFRDAKKVKQYCVDKLTLNAHRAGILQNAEIHGKELLKNFFTLMTGKEIKRVFFHNDRFIQLSQEIAADEWVNYHEATLLDSQLTLEWASIDSLRQTRENSHKNQQMAAHKEENINVVLSQLRQLPFQDMPGTFSYLSKMTYEIAEDSLLDSLEMKTLENMRWNIPEGTQKITDFTESRLDYWFEDSLSYIGKYNAAIDYLLKKEIVPGNLEEVKLLKTELTPAFLEENWVKNYTFTHADSVKITLVREKGFPRKDLLELLYPFNFNSTAWDHFVSEKNLWRDSFSEGQGKLDHNDSTVWVYDAMAKPPIKRMGIPLDQLMNPHVLQKFAGKDLVWISDSLCFIQSETSMDDLKTPGEQLLTERQSAEMEAFYRLLVKSHQVNHGKGPVVRANEWVQKKLEFNKSFSDRFSELRKKVLNQIP